MLVDLVLFFMRKPSNSRNSHLVFRKHITYHILSYFSWKTVIREKVESPSQGFIMLIVHLCQSFKANIPSIFLHNLRLSPVRFQNFHKIDLKLGMDICLTYSSTFHRSFEGSDNISIHTYIQVFVFIKISKFVRTISFFSKTKKTAIVRPGWDITRSAYSAAWCISPC